MTRWKNMGLVFIAPAHLGFGFEHGALRWLPHWAQRAIVYAWNPAACFVFGHRTFGDRVGTTCMHCSRRWP